MQWKTFSKKQVYDIIFPLILEQLFMAAIGMFDVVMVSGIGENAISAISLVDFINQLINSVLTALATGGAIVCSQYIGRKKVEDARNGAQHLTAIVGAAGFLFMAVCLILQAQILRALYRVLEPDVMNYAKQYFTLTAIGYPFVALFCSSAAIMRVLGFTKVSFKNSAVMNVLNIALNALFIFVFHWGVIGAGLASLLSRAIISLVLFARLYKVDDMLNLKPVYQWRLNAQTTGSILQYAVPTSVESSLFYVGRLLVQSVVTSYGTAAIAANAVSLAIAEVLHMPGAGVGIAMITIIGRCIGADEKQEARDYATYLLKLVYVVQGIACAVSAVFAAQLAGLYNLSPETLRLAVTMLRTHSLVCALIWPLGFTVSNVIKSAGDVRFTMVVSFASMWGCRLGGSYLFGWMFPQLGIMNVWLAMYLDWAVRGGLYLHRFLGTKWLNKKAK